MADTILITGGAGFIGANLVRRVLAATSHRAVVLDKLTYAGSRETLDGLDVGGRLAFVQGDIGDYALVGQLLVEHRPRWVANLAAETHVDRSIDSAEPFVETNLVGTFRLLEACRRHWSRLPAPEREAFRFLHVSTDEVYGSLPPDGAATEQAPYAPNSPYAATKAGADHLVRAWSRTYGLPAIVTHSSNNYGPWQFPEKLVPLSILNALEGRDLPLYGDGLQARDWIHVEDHCAGLLRALQSGRPGERYNLGGGNERTNRELVEQLCAALEAIAPAGRNPALAARGAASYLELVRLVADRPGHDRRYAIDSAHARTTLGWTPGIALADGLAAAVRWYVEHRSWCESVQAGRYDRGRLGLGPGGKDGP